MAVTHVTEREPESRQEPGQASIRAQGSQAATGSLRAAESAAYSDDTYGYDLPDTDDYRAW